MKVNVRPAAKVDLVKTAEWYDSQQFGLGDESLDEVVACLNRLKSRPVYYEAFHQDFRRVMLHRFPYIVYYRIIKNQIEVYGVIHSAMDTPSWRARLR